MNLENQLGLRWTIGDVSDEGFAALQLSIWGAWHLFGPTATYAICVNTVPLADARAKVGAVPAQVQWLTVTRADIPAFIRVRLHENMAEGVGWKFAPLRVFPDRYELALDNDCILWRSPAALTAWVNESGSRCLFAEDVSTCLGQFTAVCGGAPRNSGIRGLPPGFNFAQALQDLLREHPVTLQSELDEQGLQAAAVSRREPPLIVTVQEVSICSPFAPHLPHLGECGAHFVGLNARQLPWSYANRPASEYIREHWMRHRPTICEHVQLPCQAREILAPAVAE